MQTTMTNIWQDVYTDFGIVGIFIIIVVYAMLADRGILPKFWLNKNGKNELKTVINNHIEHLRQEVGEIRVLIEKRASFDWVEKELKDLKDDLNKRMDRIERRCN